jgi:hypothetical protein
MGSRARTRMTLASLAISSALLISASQALAVSADVSSASSGPIANKSGALINYVSTARLKIAKRIEIQVVCSANCNVTSTVVFKGVGQKIKSTVAGPLTANVPGSHFIKPNGVLLKAMRANTKKVRLVNNMTATDPVTGVQDHISHVFKLKR